MPSGSIPASLFMKVAKHSSALIARIPPSGSDPVKWLSCTSKWVTARMLLSGSEPVKLFVSRWKEITAIIARMPSFGTAPVKLFLEIQNFFTFFMRMSIWTGSVPVKRLTLM
eukprot:1809915-Amphidinium_carterae.1